MVDRDRRRDDGLSSYRCNTVEADLRRLNHSFERKFNADLGPFLCQLLSLLHCTVAVTTALLPKGVDRWLLPFTARVTGLTLIAQTSAHAGRNLSDDKKDEEKCGESF
jgi:hypothetical protein